jgi:hypothetical protein
MLETQLHLVNGVVILLAVAIPIYLTIRLKNNMRKLTAILCIFILIHPVRGSRRRLLLTMDVYIYPAR